MTRNVCRRVGPGHDPSSGDDGASHPDRRTAPPPEAEASCPTCRAPARRVGWRTVAALARGPLPRRQEYRVCETKECGTVYFGSEGATFAIAALRVEPGFKSEGDGLMCYCFEVRRSDLQEEDELGCDACTVGAAERIAARVEAGDCACEVRNPTGRCCLSELDRFGFLEAGSRSR